MDDEDISRVSCRDVAGQVPFWRGVSVMIRGGGKRKRKGRG